MEGSIGVNSLVHEIHIFSKLAEVAHPNIVSFIGACSLGDDICLCTEFVPDGSLFSYLHQKDEGYTSIQTDMDFSVLTFFCRLATISR